MTPRRLLFCALLLLTKIQTATAALPFTLAKDGQPASAIVVARTPTKAAALAAVELQTHVRLVTGATLPIVTEDQAATGTRLLVGESALTRALGYSSASFTTQEYAIVFTNDARGAVLALLGRDQTESFDTGALGVFGDPLTWVAGRYGNAASFDGSNVVYSVLPWECGFRDDVGTVEFWVQFAGNNPSGETILLVNDYGGHAHVFTRGDNRVRYYVESTEASLLSPPLSAGWHHVVGTHRGGVINLFVDGQRLGPAAKTYTPNPVGPSGFAIGSYWGGQPTVPSGFHGQLDEVRFSSCVRDGADADTDRPPTADSDTLLLLHFDSTSGVPAAVYQPKQLNLTTAVLPRWYDEQGTCYAVYDFLERFCGVRWLNPTELGTDCPAKPTLTVRGQNVRRSPYFDFRLAYYDDPAGYDAYTALWAAETDGFKRWEAAAYAELHRQYPNANAYQGAKRRANELYLLRNRQGGAPHLCNHALGGYWLRFWQKHADPAVAKLFVRQEPDWFAQGYQGTPPQMCYTSTGLVQQLAQDARDYYDGKKTGNDLAIFWGPRLPNPFPVEPMDNSSFCDCPRCQAWVKGAKLPDDIFSTATYSDYIFNFVNEVAKDLGKTHPDKPLIMLAYGSHAAPPATFRLAPTVEVLFCFACNRWPGEQTNYQNELRLLQQWSEEAKTSGRRLGLWLYYTFPVEGAHNGNFHCFPGFFAHTIGKQFALFRQYGYRGMMHCGYGQEVEAYVTYRLMDDPTLAVDKLLDEYFRRVFGAAAAPLRELYGEIEKVYTDPANYPKGVATANARFQWEQLGTEKRMARYANLMARAQKLARTERERRQVELFELGTWDYMVAGRRQFVERLSAAIPSAKAPKVAEAGGDVAKVAWDQAALLGGGWHDRGEAALSARNFAGRIGHDSQFLYLELTDPCDTKKLVSSSMVFPADDWEIFIAAQRSLPYRQYAVNPAGLVVALSDGEVNFRMNVEIPEHGIKAVSDASAPDKWVTRLAIPLANVVKGGVAPKGKFYMNILRVSSGNLKSPGQQSAAYGVDSWVSHCTVHNPDRLAEIQLQ